MPLSLRGALATKQSRIFRKPLWIASPFGLAMTSDIVLAARFSRAPELCCTTTRKTERRFRQMKACGGASFHHIAPERANGE
jgi:hypothetical protein